MAAPSPWTCYDQFKLKLGNKLLNLGTDVIKVALFTSTSNANTTALATATFASLTNEVSSANGYTTAGATVTPTWSNAAGTETFTTTNPSWTASGAGLTTRYAVIYDSTTGDLICWCTLDSAPADVVVSVGNSLTIQMSGTGVFTLA